MQNALSIKSWPRVTTALVPLLVLVVLSIVVNASQSSLPEAIRGYANDVIWTLASALTLFRSYIVYRNNAGDTRKAWLLITLACGSWTLGMLIWNYHRFVLDSYPEFPSLTDLGFLVLSPLVTLGIIFFRKDTTTVDTALSQLLRIGLVFTALLIIHFLIYGTLIDGATLSNTFIITSLSYPLLYFTTVIHGLTENWHQSVPKQQTVILLLIVGILIHGLANAEYAYSLLALEPYSYLFVDIAWTLGFLPIYCATVVQEQVQAHEDAPRRTTQTKMAALVDKGFLPLLLLSLSLTIYLNRSQFTFELLDGFLLLLTAFTVQLVGYIWMKEDRERAFDDQLYEKDLTFNSLVEAIPYGIQEYDTEGNITYCNESMSVIMGEGPRSSSRKKFWDFAVDRNKAQEVKRTFFQIVSDRPPPESFTVPSVREDDEAITLKVDWNYRYKPDGDLGGIVSVITDITRQRENEEELRFLAHHDSLTQLPNRSGLSAELEAAIHRAERRREQFAILFVDLDQFKHINDSLGHAVGDKILVAAGERLRGIARTEETVARHGGDEFVCIVEQVGMAGDAAAAAERILAALREPFEIDDRQMHVTPSIGIAIYPDNGGSSEVLLKNADAAMYRAKAQGRNRYAYYSEELTKKASERILYDSQLRLALERDQLSLCFQPQVDVKRKRVHGIEALLRWEHPELGQISPSTFIPIAEESGLINEIGEWVLVQSCQFLKTLLAQGADIKLSVNVSGIQFLSDRFASLVARVLDQLDLDGRHLEIEITESTVMNDRVQSVETLYELSRMGISLSIDDFGTGYSSLSYLKKLPIDQIKIDRSFTRDIPADKDDAAIARSIIALGRELNMSIVAEGVEQPEQLEFLCREGCFLVQGYLVSRPMEGAELLSWLRRPSEWNGGV